MDSKSLKTILKFGTYRKKVFKSHKYKQVSSQTFCYFFAHAHSDISRVCTTETVATGRTYSMFLLVAPYLGSSYTSPKSLTFWGLSSSAGTCLLGQPNMVRTNVEYELIDLKSLTWLYWHSLSFKRRPKLDTSIALHKLDILSKVVSMVFFSSYR